jgi:hypothetical protein
MSEQREQPIGISVSGGGLRSASFGLGVLQALQHRYGLLRGECSADYLTAVSGGSYIAGAYTLVNCSDRIRPADDDAEDRALAASAGAEFQPFAPGSPEAEHLRRHCRYIVEDGGVKTSLRFGGLVVLNLLTVLSIVVWAGVLLVGDCGVLASAALPDDFRSDAWVWLQWLLAALAVGMLARLIASVGDSQQSRPRNTRAVALRLAIVFIGLPIYAVAMAGLLARVDSAPLLRSPQWLIDHGVIVIAGICAVMAVTALASTASRRVSTGGITLQRTSRVGLFLLTRGLVQCAGTLVLLWSASWIYRHFLDETVIPLIAFFAALCAPLVMQPLIDRASPHHAYRDMLTRCFSVIRVSDNAAARPDEAGTVLLSQLAPPEGRGADRFPKLVICAAANVSDVGATPAGSNVLSLIVTPSEIAVPAIPEATVGIRSLERLTRPRSLTLGQGPAITLASAVAMTGAAVSPAMGKMTRQNLRALFTSLNVRLGVWLPNVLDSVTRADIASPEPKNREVKLSMDDLVAEMFGFHSSRSSKLYVSDGGHYDNLGLVELLRRKCRVIWCVDASGDRPGTARALSDAILLAAGEHGARVSVDLDRFALVDGAKPSDPLLRESHAVGTVTYADGTTGKLVIVKLGLTPTSPPELHQYRRNDRRFPHHATVNQIYRSERFDAYRALGWSSGLRAADDQDVVLIAGGLRQKTPKTNGGVRLSTEHRPLPNEAATGAP